MPNDQLTQALNPDIVAARTGDQAAFARVVGRCQNTVTALALAIVRDVQASEDIAQEAFLKAWQQMPRLRSEDSFLPWLRQITRNLARDHLRARRCRPASVEEADALIARAADTAPCPAQHHAMAEEQAMAAGIIEQLPDDSREVLILFHREGCSSQQVAQLLGLSDAAVRKRLSRAREAVRQELLRRLGTFARGTAPGAAFTSAVVGALVLASPPAAAASILGAGAASAGSGAVGKVLAGSAGSLSIGLVLAFAGMWWGLRRQLAVAVDDQERRGLVRITLVNAATTVGFMIAITLSAAFTTGWIAPIASTVVFMAILFWQILVVEPGVVARRHAEEARIDPEAAARKRHRERVICWTGLMLGLVFGGGGMITGLVLSGRL